MMKNWKKSDYIYWGMMLLPFVISACFYTRLPEQVPTQWNMENEISSYSSRAMAAWGIPAFMFVMAIVLQFSLSTDPRKENINRSGEMKIIAKWLIAILAVACQLVIVLSAVGIPMNVSLVMRVPVAVMIILMGNYMPKCKQNYVMGIKTPWALNDEENWNKTHRLGGYVWIIGGVIMLVDSFLNIPYLSFAVLMVLGVVPFAYSYMLYRKKSSSQEI